VLVVERRLVGSDDTASALDVVADLGALLRGERGDVGKYEHLEAIDVFGIEQAVVDHLKGTRDSMRAW